MKLRWLVVLVCGAVAGSVLTVLSGGGAGRVTLTLAPRPERVPLPSPRVWTVPAPSMLPGRLQQILTGVKALDRKLSSFDIKAGDWQELMTASLKHVRHTEDDLQHLSKHTAEVQRQAKKYLSSPGPPGMRGPMGQPGPMGADGGMGDVGGLGPEGNEGDAGVSGSEGPIGAVGPSGALGKPGRRGKPGRPGIAGATGFQGETGKMGDRGKQGRPGDPGLVGPAGMNVVGIDSCHPLMDRSDRSYMRLARDCVHLATHRAISCSARSSVCPGDPYPASRK